MKIFSIVGWSGSGKTTLITRLIEDFAARKKRVIAVKSTHADYAVQPEGKDTARFLQAGAREAYLLAGGELLRMTRNASPDDLLADLEARLRPDDVVLLEGLTRPGIPVIEVQDPRPEKKLKTRPADLAAVISAGANACSRPCFHPDDIAAIGAFLEAYHGK
jgi:molybdopterin-guanine dinucleotide biosynthesis adapter protein